MIKKLIILLFLLGTVVGCTTNFVKSANGKVFIQDTGGHWVDGDKKGLCVFVTRTGQFDGQKQTVQIWIRDGLKQDEPCDPTTEDGKIPPTPTATPTSIPATPTATTITTPTQIPTSTPTPKPLPSFNVDLKIEKVRPVWANSYHMVCPDDQDPPSLWSHGDVIINNGIQYECQGDGAWSPSAGGGELVWFKAPPKPRSAEDSNSIWGFAVVGLLAVLAFFLIRGAFFSRKKNSGKEEAAAEVSHPESGGGISSQVVNLVLLSIAASILFIAGAVLLGSGKGFIDGYLYLVKLVGGDTLAVSLILVPVSLLFGWLANTPVGKFLLKEFFHGCKWVMELVGELLHEAFKEERHH